ncbi:MAG: IPT/TIG domain-containing protein [Chloroflexi bacterium]|nr:IPT/TIG domain-containing protein [Chloroflexota bacterium]MBU1748323.1 IPT/TIG domain-containing protein [Chloroflexota bacterium]
MNKRSFASVATALLSITALLILLALMAWTSADAPTPARAAPLLAVPTVTGVAPTSAPNDLDTPLVVTGTGFTTSTLVLLGDDPLPSGEVGWVSATVLTATVPWGTEPGVYTVTVFNPGEGSGSRPNAFTVTQGLGVWTTNGPYGGHISQIRIHPDTPTTVYAVALQMGVFVSYDGGANWQPFLMEGIGEGIEFDAQDRDIMYLGSGRRTMDGGQTWETLTIHTPIPFKGWAYHLTADPLQAGRLYAAANTPHPELKGGILRSDNYGEYGSWITLTEGISDTQFTVIAVHPADNDTLLAGTESGNLYYSLNGGQDWHWATQIEETVSRLFFNPYEPLEAWATACREDSRSPWLHKSTNLTTWTPIDIDPGQTQGSNGWSLGFLPDKIWAGAWGVYTSTNGGDSWTPVPDPAGAMSLDVHPDRPQEIYFGEFTNGVFKSADGGNTWQETNQGLAGVNPSSVLVAPDDLQTIYVKIDPGLFKSENGGQSWRSLNFGGGGFPARTKLAIDPFQPNRLYFGHGCPDSTCLWISDDGGESWTVVTVTLPAAYASWGGGFWTLAPHPGVPGQIFAGVQVGPPEDFWDQSEGLFYSSNDYGVTWNHIGPTQPISPVREIAFDSQNPNLIYIATQGSGLWKSTDGGQSWVATPSPAGLKFIETVATHPEIGETVYVGAGDGLGGPDCGVYVSDDAGETWTFLSFGIGGQLLFSPTMPPTLYGGEASGQFWGLVRSTDGGQTWQRMVDAPYPISLATGTDGERVVLYIGTPGGMVQVTLEDVLRGAGVYRWTSRLPTARVYLPLVCRGYAP